MVLDLKEEYVYGPVNSRRLGSSLGINILPLGKKVCSLNCLYCQYGKTMFSGLEKHIRFDWPGVDEVVNAVESALKKLDKPPDYITFSGNGEATLHPLFDEMVDAINDLRDRVSMDTKTAILSNSTQVTIPSVLEVVQKLDKVIMKLDCGDPETYNNYNRPLVSVTIAEIANHLANINSLVVQTLWTCGTRGNLNKKNLAEWKKLLIAIHPEMVQLYSLDRPCNSDQIQPASFEELDQIKIQLEALGISARVYSRTQ